MDIFTKFKDPKYEDRQLADLVLHSSLDVHKQDQYGWTLLALAAKTAKPLTAAALIEERNANVDQTNKHDKSTPLFWAAREGDDDIVELLLKHDANPNKATKNGLTPLLVAARERQDKVIKVLLVSPKVNVDQTDHVHRTPLHYACESKPSESEPKSTAKLLIERGASNLPDNNGITPFHIVQEAMAELLSALLDLEKRHLKLLGNYPFGASYLVKDPYGHLPANQAVRFGSDHLVEMLTLADETNVLAETLGQSGYSPLHRSLTISYQLSKRESIVEFLLKSKKEHGFDDHKYHAKIIESVRRPDPKGNYPLHLALQFSPSKKIIKLLLEADPYEPGRKQILSIPGSDGFTPLHTAIATDHLDKEIIKMLIKYDKTGETVLTREPKNRKLPIHFSFDKSLPSVDELKAVVDGDWEKRSVYMRDGNGSIALHHLLRKQTKDDDPKLVAALAEILLSESEKQTFGKEDGLPGAEKYSPLVMLEDRDTGMLPLHMAYKYGAPFEVIDLLMKFEDPNEETSRPSLIVDKAGKLPLHHACENPSTNPASIYLLLAHSELDSIAAMEDIKRENLSKYLDYIYPLLENKKLDTIAAIDKQKNLPLFLALRLENVDLNLLDALLPDKGSQLTEMSSMRRKMEEPKDLLDKISPNTMNEELKELLQQKIESKTAFRGIVNVNAIEWLYHKCRGAGIEDYKVNDAIMATLDSQTTIDWLNAKSYSRWSVFLLMSDMYGHITWIIVFITASKTYLSNLYLGNNEDYQYSGRILLFVSGYFLIFREAIEVFGNDSLWTYLKDPWNWFEMAAIACVITSGTYFVYEEQSEIAPLLITTGLFQFAFAVSFLRTTFLAYAQFVGGILNILYELIPFFLVTGMILMAFAFASFVQNFNDDDEEIRANFANFGESFLTLFGEFLGGPERPKTVSDILFGVISVVILLNVVIAIISNAWDDSTGETTIRFWQYRLGFIEEVAYTKEVLKKPVTWFRQCCIGDRTHRKRTVIQPLPPTTKTTPEEKEVSPSVHKVKHHLAKPHDVHKPDLTAWETFGFWVSYLFLLLLGLCSFGQAWPNRIRKDVFGRNKRTVVLKKEDKEANSATLDGIHKSVQQLNGANMEERMKKVEADMQGMKGTMNEVHDLLKKLAPKQSPEPQRGTEET
ncbi:unnamed protein product [Cylindrotheca closterium]|uniref:Ion transport domain-containing protein n=1 Tax=Cylindrotheca closterium TaxID=2856 RepID=A0AAD2JMT8_9STRA|nr:unnamed protein product [Cylindrotheca closterium]